MTDCLRIFCFMNSGIPIIKKLKKTEKLEFYKNYKKFYLP